LRWARGEPPPGYHPIYNVIRAIPDDLKTLALGGEKAYREAYDLVHRREAERPNQIWQADHTQCELWAKRANGKSDRTPATRLLIQFTDAAAPARSRHGLDRLLESCLLGIAPLFYVPVIFSTIVFSVASIIARIVGARRGL